MTTYSQSPDHTRIYLEEGITISELAYLYLGSWPRSDPDFNDTDLELLSGGTPEREPISKNEALSILITAQNP